MSSMEQMVQREVSRLINNNAQVHSESVNFVHVEDEFAGMINTMSQESKSTVWIIGTGA